ncbi:TPR domain-containing glycosyltransferase [Clostridium sp. ZS2-4]|uniref:TPR domain-containing glycosyltransferase n=1 Tax=Clostridium sp. ZS2-4 TaxID=2987703 RepID=UPI00227B2AE3|nr:TPR domain-containing glycosyltransferase [Clostridium sp. ZS2-4]MCY6353970.1 glycosyltransferase [Clostridium sp. ZS2-4]
MEKLSIVIKDDLKENIYSYIKTLKPLLEDRQSQLVIVNNLEEKLNIEYNHIIYEFKEDYKKFHEFCNASCFNNNIMIIESGMVLSEDLVKSIKELLIKYKNINIKADLKKYYIEGNYYKKESCLIYNTETSVEEKLKIEIDDFHYLNYSGVYINHNIAKFIEDNKFKELYLWYKNYIMKEEDIKLKFYDYVEKLKINTSINIKDEIEKYFILENLDSKYCKYITLSKIIEENNLSIDKLSTILEEARFDEKDSYFRYMILKLFKDKKFITEMFNVMDRVYIKAYMKQLFEEYEEFDLSVYQFLISTNVEELSKEEIKNIVVYMYIIEIYFENISLKSAEKSKKEKIVELFKIYSQYGIYLINNNLSMDIKRKDFLIKLKKIASFISLNRFKEAIDSLKEICEVYQAMIIPIRYYIQKLICENKLYSNVLSITMIVKNEEKNLERCLKSVKPLIDNGLAELIIVDTGSDDKTVDIAKRYTDRVYFHPWQGSFSEARNWSISLAEGQYIFIMDADYEIEDKIYNFIKFFKGKDYKNYNTFSVKIKDYDDSEYKKYTIISQYLIFKNDGSFYYSGNVHNQPNFNKPIKNFDLTIFHYGYIMDSKEIKEGKFKRTANLLKRELQKDPNNIYYRYQLTHSYSMNDNHMESLNQSKIFMKILNKEPLNYEYVMYYITAAMTNFINKLYDETIKICDDILSLNPEFIDAVYFKAQSLFFKENFQECIQCYEKYLELLQNINNNPITLDTRIQLYSMDGKDIAESDIETSYLKIEDYSGFLNYIFSNKNKGNILLHISGIVKSFLELDKMKEMVLFFDKYILKGIEKEQVNYSYYIKDEIENMKEEQRVNLLKEFNKLTKNTQYIYSIKRALEKKEGNTLKDIIKFLSFNNIEALNLITMKRLLGNTALILIDNKDLNLSLEETIQLRKITKYILIQVLNKKSFKGLNKEQILKIIFKYMDYSFSVYENSKESLSNKEVLFLENILLAFQHIQNKDLISAVKSIKDATFEDQDMANAMAVYVETITCL